MKIAANTSYNSNTKKNATFGYNYETHRAITQKALEQIPEFEGFAKQLLLNRRFKSEFSTQPTVSELLRSITQDKEVFDAAINKMAINKGGLEKALDPIGYKSALEEKFVNEIQDGTMLPDLFKSEIGFITNRHFYFLPKGNSSKKSWGLDTNKNNALEAYRQQLKKTANPDNYSGMPSNLGMGLHYLQDMTVPMHTERTGTLRKIADFFMHKNFETGEKLGILSKQEEFLANYKPHFEELEKRLPENYSPEDVFISNVKFSTQSEMQVSRGNKEDWPEIQQQAVNRAVDSTVLLLKNFMKNAQSL